MTIFKQIKEDLQDVFFILQNPHLYYDHMPSEIVDFTDTQMTFHLNSTVGKYLSAMKIPIIKTDLDVFKVSDLYAFLASEENMKKLSVFYERIDLVDSGLEKEIKSYTENMHKILLSIMF
jgi:hypothetical protein